MEDVEEKSKATPELSLRSLACLPCKDISVLRVCFENVPKSSLEEKLKLQVVIDQHHDTDKMIRIEFSTC